MTLFLCLPTHAVRPGTEQPNLTRTLPLKPHKVLYPFQIWCCHYITWQPPNNGHLCAYNTFLKHCIVCIYDKILSLDRYLYLSAKLHLCVIYYEAIRVPVNNLGKLLKLRITVTWHYIALILPTTPQESTVSLLFHSQDHKQGKQYSTMSIY